MADAYQQLLEATIAHLHDLREHGVKYVAVAPESLAALATPAAKTPRPATPSASGPASTAAGLRTPTSRPQPGPARTAPAPRPPTGKPPGAPAPSRTLPSAPAGVGQPALAFEAVSRQALSPEEKAAGMAALRVRAQACAKCAHLAASRRNVVFGVGDIHSPLMFVGEAPGADEDAQGEPFVGAAGQLLTKIIQTMGLSRSKVYIANILKCRPDTPGQTSGNRKPTPGEMAACLPFLLEQLDLIQPKVIVALGATAVEGLLGKTEGITKLRGHWREFRGVPLMPTYHPAYLLRNQALSEKRRVWEDLLQVMERLGMPITSRQRNYFLKP